MKVTTTRFLGDSNCPYMIDGVHLTSLRRAKLAPYAEAMGIDAGLPKHIMITQMMQKLITMGIDPEADAELTTAIEPAAKEPVVEEAETPEE